VQALFETTGARDEIEATIGALTAEAVGALARAPLTPESLDALEQLAVYVGARDT